ncbi:TPA: hypothetical protein I7682_17725 [Vibrio vulnificus]|nr:hypothetical protein [Vibrio vulnificus]
MNRQRGMSLLTLAVVLSAAGLIFTYSIRYSEQQQISRDGKRIAENTAIILSAWQQKMNYHCASEGLAPSSITIGELDLPSLANAGDYSAYKFTYTPPPDATAKVEIEHRLDVLTRSDRWLTTYLSKYKLDASVTTTLIPRKLTVEARRTSAALQSTMSHDRRGEGVISTSVLLDGVGTYDKGACN